MALLAIKAHEKGVELAVLVEPDVPSALKGDPGRLRQILTNLVGNAIKFTDQGEVDVHVILESEDETGANMRFSVRDSGIGIYCGLETLNAGGVRADYLRLEYLGGIGGGTFGVQRRLPFSLPAYNHLGPLGIHACHLAADTSLTALRKVSWSQGVLRG